MLVCGLAGWAAAPGLWPPCSVLEGTDWSWSGYLLNPLVTTISLGSPSAVIAARGIMSSRVSGQPRKMLAQISGGRPPTAVLGTVSAALRNGILWEKDGGPLKWWKDGGSECPELFLYSCWHPMALWQTCWLSLKSHLPPTGTWCLGQGPHRVWQSVYLLSTVSCSQSRPGRHRIMKVRPNFAGDGIYPARCCGRGVNAFQKAGESSGQQLLSHGNQGSTANSFRDRHGELLPRATSTPFSTSQSLTWLSRHCRYILKESRPQSGWNKLCHLLGLCSESLCLPK